LIKVFRIDNLKRIKVLSREWIQMHV